MAGNIQLLLISALPIAMGLALCSLWRRISAQTAAFLGAASLLISAALCIGLLPDGADLSWIWLALPDAFATATSGHAAGVAVPFALSAGLLQLVFALSCALVAFAVILYALRERQADPAAARLHAQMTLFAGAMLLFVTADTLIILYAAWEAMGVLSYFLITHSGTDKAARAARQAFWTTRVTDTGLLFAVLITMSRLGWTTLSSIDLHTLLLKAVEGGGDTGSLYSAIGLISFLLLFAALGKAAQWPLTFWLSGAMTATTPVSALLHAASMVAAGPFLLCQFHGILVGSEAALAACVYVGGATMLFSGLMAACAEDAKQLLAYSTASQLGLAIMGVGALAEESSILHLAAHAWLKAPLFLAVGFAAAYSAAHSTSLIDLRGTLRRRPFAAVLVTAAAGLCGIPFLGGSWAKEGILYALATRAGAMPPGSQLSLGSALPMAASAWKIGELLAIAGSFLTAIYLVRLCASLLSPKVAVRSGEEGLNRWRSAHLAGLVLALGGALGFSVAYLLLRTSLASGSTAWKWESGSGEIRVMLISAVVAALGSLLGMRSSPGTMQAQSRQPALARLSSFFAEGMHLEAFWRAVIGAPGWIAAVCAARGDVLVIDGAVMGLGRFGRLLSRLSRWVDEHIVDGLRYWACEVWWILRRAHQRLLQTGYIQHYMFIVLLGAVILSFVILRPLADIFGRILERY